MRSRSRAPAATAAPGWPISALLDRDSKAFTWANGWTRVWSNTRRQRVPRRLQRRRPQPPQPVHRRRSRQPVRHRDSAARRGRRTRFPAVPVRRRQPSRRTSAISGRTRSAICDQASFSLSNNLDLAGRRALAEDRRHLHAQLRQGRLFDRRQRVQGRLQLLRLRHRQRLRRLPARPSQRRARAAQHARRPADGHVLERLGGVLPGRLEAEPAADAVPRPALRGDRRVRRSSNDIYANFVPDRRRPSRRARTPRSRRCCRPGAVSARIARRLADDVGVGRG